MTLLRVDASIQGPRSASSALADQVLAEFHASRPDEPVVTRHLGEAPLPADAWAQAIGGAFTPEADRSPAQNEALAVAAAVAAELSDADAAVLALRSTTSASPSTSRPGSTSPSPGPRSAHDCSRASPSCS